MVIAMVTVMMMMMVVDKGMVMVMVMVLDKLIVTVMMMVMVFDIYDGEDGEFDDDVVG